ncbi:hypothetical protein M413DRAFT_443541 [Hebeloma cylindrosporum]|uniref:Macrofage activating glycoprotein n=1 Tax=Hebeloma cylindrosporum TaxID=76867 RepID=A0A0C2YRI6_HEBCY|nr:hypothetical protein M413DRAFT_443541 [Hebeloma cylindrosporum h7]
MWKQRYPVVLSLLVSSANSQGPLPTGTVVATPLVSKHFSYPTGVPYQADTDIGGRGPQLGYNLCNSSTQNPASLCQTSLFNGLADFCVWGPPESGAVFQDVTGEMVAWCTRSGYGTRLIPDGALTGLQFLKTPDYIQINGFLDQTKVNIYTGELGGQLDPHAVDGRGNPIGGLMFSNIWGGSYTQVIEWITFMGQNMFCIKACNPASPNAAAYCAHQYDRIGCPYNAPSNVQETVFQECDADNAEFPGVYTFAGVVQTYTQPPASLGPITSIPYVPKVPASSNCRTFSSADILGSSASGVAKTTETSPKSTGTGGDSDQGVGVNSALGSQMIFIHTRHYLYVSVVFCWFFI